LFFFFDQNFPGLAEKENFNQKSGSYSVRKLANGEIHRIIAKTLFQVKTFEDP
jgi:hypothetical protein